MMEVTDDFDVKATPIRDHTWSLVGPLGLLVSINLNTGEMAFGENYSPDEAAQTFWEAVMRNIKLT